MSERQKKLADFITAHTDEAVYMNVKQMAQQAGVSEASVVRFATFLGYGGFREMQRDIRGEVESGKSIVERFMKALASDNQDLTDTDQIYNQTLYNLNETIRQIPDSLYDEAISLISSSRRIGIAATRVAIGPAITLQILLNQLIPNCQLLIPGLDTSFDIISTWDKEDLIIAFSFMKKKISPMICSHTEKKKAAVSSPSVTGTAIVLPASVISSSPCRAKRPFSPLSQPCTLLIRCYISFQSKRVYIIPTRSEKLMKLLSVFQTILNAVYDSRAALTFLSKPPCSVMRYSI